MRARHVLGDGGVAARQRRAHMAGDAGALVKHLDRQLVTRTSTTWRINREATE